MLMKMCDLVKDKDHEKGFTLIELLVVMAILAILAVLAVPKFADVMAKARQNANDRQVGLIANTAETYYDSHNQDFSAIGSDINKLAPDYLKQVPEQPLSTATPKAKYSITYDAATHTLTVIPGLCLDGVPDKDGTKYVF